MGRGGDDGKGICFIFSIITTVLGPFSRFGTCCGGFIRLCVVCLMQRDDAVLEDYGREKLKISRFQICKRC